ELFWGYPKVRTIYQNLQDAGKTWKVYYHDVSQAFYFRDLLQEQHTRFMPFAEFEPDVERGALPQYSFIEPRFFGTRLEPPTISIRPTTCGRESGSSRPSTTPSAPRMTSDATRCSWCSTTSMGASTTTSALRWTR